jgi:hypothetical protein
MAVRSGDRLPVGWHEGLAQYVQRERSELPRTVSLLRRAANRQSLLAWATFEQAPAFYTRADVAYPESYAVVAYLTDCYGFGRFLAFLDALRGGTDTQQALEQAFGRAPAELEAEWRAALPSLLSQDWPEDALQAASLTPSVQALKEGRFTDATLLAERSERFWRDLSRADRAGEAAALRTQAEGRLALATRLGSARDLLAAFRYSDAQQAAAAAAGAAADLADAEQGAAAEEVRHAALRGMVAQEALAAAETARAHFQLAEAREQALGARDAFAELGDQEATGRADALYDDATSLQQRLGAGLVAMACVIGCVTVGASVRRRLLAGPIGSAEGRAVEVEGLSL